MAKIIFSNGVGAASGSIGGNVYSRNANGAYIRNKGIPTNANSLQQQSTRAAFTVASRIWASLTEAQKQSFADNVGAYPYVDSLGQTKTYTAAQLCAAVNGRVAQLVQYAEASVKSPILVMPAPMQENSVVSVSSVYDISLDTFEVSSDLFSGNIIADPFVMLIDATAPLSNGVTRPKNEQFKAIQYRGADSSSDSTNNIDIRSAYIAKFGILPDVGQVVFVRVTVLNYENGMYSNSIYNQALIQA